MNMKDSLGKRKVLILLLILASGLILIAILSPWISPYDPTDQNIIERMKPPSRAHPFGTDRFGRDILSRVIWGARSSLGIAIFSVLISGFIGTFSGIFIGYKRGYIDSILMRLVDILLSFPSLLLGMMVAVSLGPGYYNTLIAISFVLFPRYIRFARGPTLSIREKEFIEACKAVGAGDFRVVFFHIIPNIFAEILAISALWVGLAIQLEAGLSFIGLGTQPPMPSWGLEVRDGVLHILDNPWLAIFPGSAIAFSVLVFNLLSDELQEREI